MAMRLACLLLLILLESASAQQGFVSIQCCASNTTDQGTNITWTSDDYFLDNIGICKNLSVPSSTNLGYKHARVFGTDQQSSWCYSLPTVQGQGYLVRATFVNGPMLRSIAETSFNVSIGATSISQVNSSLNFLEVEGVFVANNDNTNICLVKGKGNAYISVVELRPINDAIYLQGYSSPVLKLVSRIDLGNKEFPYRHPEDLADRIWSVEADSSGSSDLRSSEISLRGANSSIPLEVLQTAATDGTKLVYLHSDLDTSHNDYLIIFYFLELNADVQTGQRVFDIQVNGDKYDQIDILNNSSASNYREVRVPARVDTNGYLNISLVKVSDAIKYGPICNAYEVFQVYHEAAKTVQTDVDAASKLRDELLIRNPRSGILEKWYGDPCVPSFWEGLSCEETNGALVITKLDLSSKSLQGPFPTTVSELIHLKELDVQDNEFTGSVPESFASLPHLSKLSFTCNPHFNGQLPTGLSDRMNLTVVAANCDAQDPPQTQTPQGRVYLISSVAGGSVVFTIVLGIIFSCFYKRARRPDGTDHPAMKSNAVFSVAIDDPYMNPAVRSFSLQYIENAICNYKTLIGEGGFGAVYRGSLPHGEEVAVKVRSATSTQGTREFDNEVSLLSKIRHENLVPLLGYCCENDQQILVYPFMSNGSLQDRLYGEASKRKALDWPTRLSIALGAARGLMYLHTFAGRCIIHRDVKSSNILLDDSMCGKVADFGFSKYAPQEGDSGASLEVRGTAGYLDPEYYSTQHLSTKSDVFSFGVVLLEIITGREPLNIHRPRNEWSLVEWAKPFIRESRIEEIVDPSIKAGYHAEAMWRVVEAALACIEPFSIYRPSMVDIVRELEDALIIENNASEYMRSIESMGSNRFLSIERKMIASTPAPTEPSPNYCQIMAAPQPR